MSAPAWPRRRVLGAVTLGAVGGWVVAGCSGAPEPLRPSAGAPDPDLAITRQVGSTLVAQVDLITRTVERHPGLAGRLEPARAAHLEHLATLVDATPGDAPTATAPVVVPARRRLALRAVADAEAGTSETLARLAFRARSGALARLVASMAASAAQHEQALRAPDGKSPA